MREVPIYFINGLLESGKTTLIKDIIKTDFADGIKTLLIVCEEGEQEYDINELKKEGVTLVTYDTEKAGLKAGTEEAGITANRTQEEVKTTASIIEEDENQLSEAFLIKCARDINPKRVIIEFNGMWQPVDFFDMEFPKGWVIAQSLTMVNAETFGMYWNNMRTIIAEHFKYTDTVIFNRCDNMTDKASFRRCVKALNRNVQVVFEGADGESEELPLFDTTTDPIIVDDDDFGIWYLDMLDYPKRYDGKRVKIKGLAYRTADMAQNEFIPGRFAMTCCAADIQFVGFICRLPVGMQLKLKGKDEKRWLSVIARVKYEYNKQYKGEGPILYAEQYLDADKPVEEIANFS